MFIKTSIDVLKFSEYLDSSLNLVQKSRSGRLYLPVNHSISTNEDINGNNVKSSIWQKGSNFESPLFFGGGHVDFQIIIDFADQLKKQGYGKSH